MTKNEWNERCRQSIDALLAERGFTPDCSIRNQLSCMNFAPVSLDKCVQAVEFITSDNGPLIHVDQKQWCRGVAEAVLQAGGVSYE